MVLQRTNVIAVIAAAAMSFPAVALGAAPAKTRAGLMPLQVEGTLPPKGEDQLSTSIMMSLQTTGATVIPAAELQQALGASLDTCTDDTCLRELAGKVQATHLLRPFVRVVESDYNFGIEVFDGNTGTLLDKTESTCELCGLSEAVSNAGDLAASLAGALEDAASATQGTLEVTSTPSGATVLIDDQVVGVTPLSLQLDPGEHTLLVRQNGYNHRERMVSLAPGEVEPIEVVLDAAGPRKPRDNEKIDKLLRITAWTSLGVGAAALGSGIALIAIDESPVKFTRCDGDDVDAEGNCRFRHSTLGGGIAMTLVGVVGVAAGTVLLIRDKRRNGHQSRARVRPTARGLAVHF